MFPEARWLIKPDTSARENFLCEALCRETQQMSGILKPAVRRKVLRVTSMAPRRVGKAIGHSIAFARARTAEARISGTKLPPPQVSQFRAIGPIAQVTSEISTLLALCSRIWLAT